MDLAGYRPTLAEAAGLFGKSSRWISELRAKDELPGDGATLAEIVAAWSRIGAKTTGIEQHKIRLAAAKADQAEMKSAQIRGELLAATDVTLAVQSAFARVRAKLLGLPSRIAPRVAGLKGEAAIEEATTDLVHEALGELAVTIVEGVEAGGVEGAGESAAAASAPTDADGDAPDAGRRRRGSGEVVAGADAAAKADGKPVGRRTPGAEPRSKRRTRTVEDEPG